MKERVFLAECRDYGEENVRFAVHRALDAFGGAEALAGGKKVLLKANLLMSCSPDEAVTTHPNVVEALVREFMSAGCEVEIADSCGGLYNEDVLRTLYGVCGMSRVAERTGAKLNYDTLSFEMPVPNGVKIKKVQVISPVKRADFIVSVAKMKTHGLTYYTGAAKNMFGVIPGLQKAVMHSRFPDKKAFCNMLVDLCEAVAPNLSFIDGVVGMEGAGPSGGKPKSAGVIVASKNPYAADIAAMDIMGLDKNKSPLHMLASKRSLVGEVELLGDAVENFRTQFEPAYTREPRTVLMVFPGALRKYVERMVAKYPNIVEGKCVGCGECVKSCPEHTIELKDGKASVKHEKCIRCYCCQEMCPARAIVIERLSKFKKRK